MKSFDEWLLPATGEPAYRALARGIRRSLMAGNLTAGSLLPSERELAERLGLSRTTITRAYRELVGTGWARSRQGSGTRVLLPVGQRSATLPLIPGLRTDAIDLAAAAGLAPPGTEKLIRSALDWLPSALASAGYEPFGASHLREQIARWYHRRGVETSPDQVIVTAGAMAAISVAVHSLIPAGRRVLVDSPTYPGAMAAIRGAGGRPVGVGLGRDWDLQRWRQALRGGGVVAAYLIADFHNPTGLVMSEQTRVALAAMLRQSGCTPVVDETLVELDLDDSGTPTPWAALDGRGICVGSVSKVLWGGVRIGWLRAPADQVDRLKETALRLSLGPSALDQLVATSFLEDQAAILPDVLERMRRARQTWLTGLARHLPQWQVRRPVGGLALWVELPDLRASDLALAAEDHGLVVTPGAAFSPDATLADRIRLPLTLPPEVVDEAVGRLASAWRDLPRLRASGNSATAFPL